MENKTLEVCTDMNSKIFASKMFKHISLLTSFYNFINENNEELLNTWMQKDNISEELHESLKLGINTQIVSN